MNRLLPEAIPAAIGLSFVFRPFFPKIGKDDTTAGEKSHITDRTFMVVLEKGRERVGQWVEESVDVLADYRKAFGKDPPAMARLAVMSDTDNAGGSAVAYLDFIEVYR